MIINSSKSKIIKRLTKFQFDSGFKIRITRKIEQLTYIIIFMFNNEKCFMYKNNALITMEGLLDSIFEKLLSLSNEIRIEIRDEKLLYIWLLFGYNEEQIQTNLRRIATFPHSSIR